MSRLVALCLIPLLVGCFGEGRGGGSGAEFSILRAGDPAPEYGARSLAGDSVELAHLRGTPVLVNLWATWCAPCRAEMPELQELHEMFGDELTMFGVSIDRAGSEELIKGFVEDVGVDFDILLDPENRVTRRFTALGVPETFLIDENGTLRKRWIGRLMPLDSANLAIVEQVVGAGGEEAH